MMDLDMQSVKSGAVDGSSATKAKEKGNGPYYDFSKEKPDSFHRSKDGLERQLNKEAGQHGIGNRDLQLDADSELDNLLKDIGNMEKQAMGTSEKVSPDSSGAIPSKL